MEKIKQWVLSNIIVHFTYKYWINLRNNNKDEYGERICYCGHTDRCTCVNPSKQLFRDSLKAGSIIFWDKNNGWYNEIK